MSNLTNHAELKELFALNRAKPDGGAKLLILHHEGYWKVTDGQRYYGKWYRKPDASKSLRECGFISHKLANTVYFHTY
jgi:hypothetical protein